MNREVLAGGPLRWAALLTAVAIALAVFGATAGAAAARTWTVDTTGDPENANCSFPGLCSLRLAMEEASNNIDPEPAVVDATQVSGTIEIGESGLNAPLELETGGAPSVTVEGPGPGLLTVDGQGTTQIIVANPSFRAAEGSMYLSGMTLENGKAGLAEAGGGAMEVGSSVEPEDSYEKPLTVENVHFINNTAVRAPGGAISQQDETLLTLVDCLFEGNIAQDDGLGAGGLGGAIASSGDLTLKRTQVGTISNGNFAVGQAGGGIMMGEEGRLTIEEGSSVNGNHASKHGGGIYLRHEVPMTIDDSEVTDNVSEDVGGGVFAGGENLITLSNGSSVNDNTAAEAGGGIYFEGGTLTLSGSAVEHNETGEGNGGGIYVNSPSEAANLNLEAGSRVADNKARGPESLGGGIFAGEGTQLNLLDSTVEGNSSPTSGGGIYAEGPSTKVRASTVSGNLAAGGGEGAASGGGIEAIGGDLWLINSTVAENVIEGSSSHGGGLAYDAGTNEAGATIANSTIAANSASGGTVGGLLAATSTDISSTIIAGNSASGGCPDAGGAGLNSDGYNIVGDDSCAFSANEGDQVNVDPELGPLQSNGGPTQTMAPAQASSPAINRGSNDAEELSTDQRGETRQVPSGNESTDVGAYEVQAPVNTTPPSISGTPTVGQTLTCEAGVWNTDHVTSGYAYTWTSDGTTVATTSEYEVAFSDEGQQLLCAVDADNGAETRRAESAALSVPAGQLAVSPTSVDFGTQQTGTTSGPQTITISNSGANPLEVEQLSLTGTGAGQFSLADPCSETTIAAGGQCQVEVVFAPGSDGGHAASLEIPSSAGSEAVALSGIGRTPAGALAIDPMSLDFGTQQTGTASGPQTLTISNSGDAALTVGQLSLAGADAAAYSLPSDGCSESALAPTEECEVEVTFAPTSDGSHAATLEIPSSSGTMEVDLSGIGRAPMGALAVGPAALDFGTQQTGTTSAPQTVTLANTGDASLTLGQLALGGAAASQYSLGDACSGITLAPGGSCPVSVAFAPSAAGPQVAALQVPSSVGTQTVSLGGTGETPSPPAPPALPPSGSSPTQPPPSPASAGADLRVQLGGPHRAVVGKRLEIRLTIANRGPEAAREVTLTTKLTGALEDVAIHGARCRGEREMVCAIGSLAPGHSRRLELTATPRRANRLDVAAAVHSTTADPAAANDRDQLPIKVTQGE